MYKLKSGVELPKEFKIKVNPEQSEALQKHLFPIGTNWEYLKDVIRENTPYLFVENNILVWANKKYIFKDHNNTQIKFKDYFEKVEETSFPKEQRSFGKTNGVLPLEIKRLQKENEELKKYNEDLNNQLGIYYKQVLMLTEKLETIKKVLE